MQLYKHTHDMMLYVRVLVVLLFKNVLSDFREDPLVHTNVGLIRGLAASDGDYSMFLGIPYAIVDKENPFAPSLPNPRFEEIFEAHDDSALCPQIDDFNTITGSLDCLQLNVFVPNSATSLNPLPVLVFLHGGFLQRGRFGRGIYGPKFLVQHNIILVTINYRLGPYGFMCLDTPEIPGNEGLKDQMKALRWIKDNIEAFGGDPTQVTISGQSAGAASVDFHLMYPEERLFNKVILQSGVALTPARMIESDSEKPMRLAEYLGFITNDLNEALAFLATKDTSSIIEATLALGIGFRACVEKEFEGVKRFIPQHPANADRNIRNIPVLIGSVSKELMTSYVDQNLDFFQNLTLFKDSLNYVFDFGDDLDSIHRNLRHFYVGDHVMTDDDKWKVIDFGSDFTYVHPIQRAMRKYIESEAGNIYYYVFNYDGGRNLNKYMSNVTAPGAAHSDDLGYLFDVSIFTEEPSPEDLVIINRMTTLWTNFVKYGNPTPTTSELIPLSWTPITASKWHCLSIDAELVLGSKPFHDRMAYWDLFFRMYGHLEKGVEFNMQNRVLSRK